MLYQFDLASNILNHQHLNFFSSMCKWDCQWYLTIIHDGYDLHTRGTPKIWHGLANWAFFPLYPYTVKMLSWITSMNAVIIGIIFNQVIMLFTLMVFYKYLKLFVNEINSRYGIVLLAFSPFSIYFSSLYTEALFLFLSLSSFYLMHTKRFLLSAICGGLLSATRPIGVMFSIPFMLYQTMYYKFNFSRWVHMILLGFISISGILLYMLFLHIHTGDYLAFQHIQKGWGRHGIDTQHIGSQIYLMISDRHNFFIFLLSCILSFYLLYRRYFAEGLFNLLCILPGVMTGTMMSEGRFAGTLFTFYFAIVLMSHKSNSLKFSILLAFIIFYTSYYLYWIAHAGFLI